MLEERLLIYEFLFRISRNMNLKHSCFLVWMDLDT